MMPTRPRILSFESLPVYGVPTSDKLVDLERILINLENGSFHDAANQCDAMMRDDRIASVLSTRVNGLLAMPLEVEPADDTRKLRMIADEVTDAWPKMFSDSAISELLRWGLMLGVGVGLNEWNREGDKYTCSLRVIHPRFLRWDWGSKSFWYQNVGEELKVTPGDGNWVVYTPMGFEYCYLRGHIRSLIHLWIKRAWAYRDWARYSEVHGLPIRKAIVPSDASDVDKRKFLQAIANLGNESVIRLPQSESAKFDVLLLEAQAQGHDGFRSLLDKIETSIAIDLLGQNLTTEVKGGSFAAAQMHDTIRSDIRRADARTMTQTLVDQSLRPWATYNYGDPDAAPLPEWQTEPPEDESQVAIALKTLSEALVSLVSINAPVDVRAILDAAGVPLIDEAEFEAMQAQEPPTPTPPPTGNGTGDAPPPDGQPPAQGGNGVQMNRAALSAVPRKFKHAKAAHKRGQFYADRLAEKAKLHGRKLMAADVADIKQIVETSTSYEQVMARLKSRLSFMDPTALAKMVEKTGIIAHLAGKYAVLEDL